MHDDVGRNSNMSESKAEGGRSTISTSKSLFGAGHKGWACRFHVCGVRMGQLLGTRFLIEYLVGNRFHVLEITTGFRHHQALINIVHSQPSTKQKSVSSEIYWIGHKTITAFKFALLDLGVLSSCTKHLLQ